MLRLETNAERYREAREAACRHDGIHGEDRNAPFVVFSETNPFLPELEAATAACLRNPHGLSAVVL